MNPLTGLALDVLNLLALPVDTLTKSYHRVDSHRDLPRDLLDQIAHFFEHYKDLDEGKWVRVDGWGGVDEAKQEILNSVFEIPSGKIQPGKMARIGVVLETHIDGIRAIIDSGLQ